MFLSLGYKSVTMDDIAAKLGISKKTIYSHFDTKTKLVDATTRHLFDHISRGITEIQLEGLNPVEENFAIKRFVLHNLKNEETSPLFQLEKYYPTIFQNLKCRQFEKVQCCITENLERGMAAGYYREDLQISFISKIYYVGLTGIKNMDMFPKAEFSNPKLMDYFLTYHLNAICTPKGLETLDNILNKHEEITNN